MKSSENPLGLTVFVPCYNERVHVCGALDTIREALAGFDLSYEILIYDDASEDDTVAVIEEYLDRSNDQGIIELIRNETNQGISVNFFRAAQRGRGRYFLVANGDNPTAAEAFRSILALLGKADLVLTYFGTRLLLGAHNFDHRIWPRRLVSVTFSCLVRFFSGLDLRFFNGTILWRRDLVLANPGDAGGSGYSAELLCRILSDPKVTFLEVKIHNHDQPDQKSSAFTMKNIISVGRALGRILARRLSN